MARRDARESAALPAWVVNPSDSALVGLVVGAVAVVVMHFVPLAAQGATAQ